MRIFIIPYSVFIRGVVLRLGEMNLQPVIRLQHRTLIGLLILTSVSLTSVPTAAPEARPARWRPALRGEID